MFLHRGRVRRALGDSLILWIDPRRIETHVGSNQPHTRKLKRFLSRLERRAPFASRATQYAQRCLFGAEPFVLKTKHLQAMTPVEAERRYVLMEDYIGNIDDVRRSAWYWKLRKEISDVGVVRHKDFHIRSEEELEDFLENYIGRIVRSMSARGYDIAAAPDVGTAIVGPDGRLLKTNHGNHRFSIARILGVSTIPVEVVGVHEDWVRSCGIGRDLDALSDGLRRVEAANR